MTKKEEQTQQSNAQPEFSIQRLYVKDLSFEAPNTPEIFNTKWEPQVSMDLNINDSKLADDVYEVVVKVLVTTKLAEKTAFLVEVQYAGIFMIKGMPDDQMKPMLGSFCPSLIFPYAREVVSDLVSRGGFPPLYLSPINFDALYQQQQQEQAEKEKKK